MLSRRIATAAVGLPILILIILLGGWWYTVPVALVLAIATLEFEGARRSWLAPLSLLSAAIVAAMAMGAYSGIDWVLWFTVGATIIPLTWVTLRGDVSSAINDWTWSLAGMLYVGLLGSHFVLLDRLDNGRDWVLLALFATFANDTAAYFVGRRFGRRKLAPAISPGKTVEGAIGGLAGGFLAVIVLNYLLGIRIEPAQVVPLALLVPWAAQLGDLAESMLKRGMRVKDSSQLLPGHGGLLDRLDSILFTALVVYYFVIWVVF